MTSRERLLAALNHHEPDRVPLDLGGSHVTTISAGAYCALRRQLDLPNVNPIWMDVIQQVVTPHDDVLERLGIDTRGLFPLCSHNWDVYKKLQDGGDKWAYHDEWGIDHVFPKEEGHWFSIVREPFAETLPDPDGLDRHTWPDAANPVRVAGLREKALAYRAAGNAVVVKGLCAGIFEMAQRLRGMQNALTDPLLYPEFSDRLYGKLADLKIAFWEMALHNLRDVVDVIVENDDYGTQFSQLISHDQYRAYLKPHQQRLFEAIKRAAPHAFLFFHSCGNVRPLIPDFLEIGVDILNPVHVTATGMEPLGLKRDFGDALTFWGGGVDSQQMLPQGTPELVRDAVRSTIEVLAPGGGYVFAGIHNIQSEVPTKNIMAMWEAAREFGVY